MQTLNKVNFENHLVSTLIIEKHICTKIHLNFVFIKNLFTWEFSVLPHHHQISIKNFCVIYFFPTLKVYKRNKIVPHKHSIINHNCTGSNIFNQTINQLVTNMLPFNSHVLCNRSPIKAFLFSNKKRWWRLHDFVQTFISYLKHYTLTASDYHGYHDCHA